MIDTACLYAGRGGNMGSRKESEEDESGKTMTDMAAKHPAD